LDSAAQLSLLLNERGVAAAQGRAFDQAETLFRQSLEADRHNLSAVFNLAGMYVTNRREDQAVSLLEGYAAELPNEPDLLARLGDAYFGVKKIDQALATYQKLRALVPKYPGIAAKLGTIFTLTNRLPDAEKAFQEAAKESPRDFQILANLSSLYLSNGKPKEAIATAKSALQLSQSADTYVTLGNAYQQTGELKNALHAYQRARRLGKESAEMNTLIQELETDIAKGKS
jgi:Flp pilus assembly protein TadD